MKKVCCGFGHRNIYENKEELICKLYDLIIFLILQNGVGVFMIGEMGDFDFCFSNAVRKAKKKYPKIKLVLVQPYFSNKYNTQKEYYEMFFDDVTVPHEIIGCHYKIAITKRNQWMIDNSDYVISYTRRNSGGAYTAVSYAEEQGKNIYTV